jgi:hypothetical protein
VCVLLICYDKELKKKNKKKKRFDERKKLKIEKFKNALKF